MRIAEVERRLARHRRGEGRALVEDDYGAATISDGKPAAVLIGLIDHGDEPSLLMTVRNANMKRHAGQVAFPGGRADPGETAVETALREAEEEVALPRGEVRVIGEMGLYRTGTGYRITPIIGVIPPGVAYRREEAEVAEIFELPLSHAIDTANHIEEATEWQGALRRYYSIDWKPQRVWGATAGMIVNLARILGD